MLHLLKRCLSMYEKIGPPPEETESDKRNRRLMDSMEVWREIQHFNEPLSEKLALRLKPYRRPGLSEKFEWGLSPFWCENPDAPPVLNERDLKRNPKYGNWLCHDLFWRDYVCEPLLEELLGEGVEPDAVFHGTSFEFSYWYVGYMETVVLLYRQEAEVLRQRLQRHAPGGVLPCYEYYRQKVHYDEDEQCVASFLNLITVLDNHPKGDFYMAVWLVDPPRETKKLNF